MKGIPRYRDARGGAGRFQSPAATITSDALITAVTLLPSARPRSRTAFTVMDATRRIPLASSSTLAMASPALMLVTRAGIWLRALSFITSPCLVIEPDRVPRLHEVKRQSARPRPRPARLWGG